jgi:hypothetical protein
MRHEQQQAEEMESKEIIHASGEGCNPLSAPTASVITQAPRQLQPSRIPNPLPWRATGPAADRPVPRPPEQCGSPVAKPATRRPPGPKVVATTPWVGAEATAPGAPASKSQDGQGTQRAGAAPCLSPLACNTGSGSRRGHLARRQCAAHEARAGGPGGAGGKVGLWGPRRVLAASHFIEGCR